jgi:hypothetical protein
MRLTIVTDAKLNPTFRAENIGSLFLALKPFAKSLQGDFASTAGGNLIPIEHEKAKLRLMLEVARKAWR